MELRTAEIIMICKGNHLLGDNLSFKEAIAAYMADRCDCPIEDYNNKIINKTIWNAALDYIDNIKDSNPSAFLRDIEEIYSKHNESSILKNVDWYEAICIAFRLVKIKNNERYINGFNQSNTAYVKKRKT